MKPHLRAWMFGLLLGLLCGIGLRTAWPQTLAAELLVRFQPHVTPERARTITASVGARYVRLLPILRVHVLRVANTRAREALLQVLARRADVDFAEPHGSGQGEWIPNDPHYRDAWHLARLDAVTGWDVTRGSPTAPLAVIDSGVDSAHPDLHSKVLPGYSFLTRTLTSRDELGHGTAVAGLAVALTHNGLGISGVAPLTPVLPLVVLNSANVFTYAHLAAAIVYAADHQCRVISMSLSGATPSQTLQAAVDYAWRKDVVLIAAAGNQAGTLPRYPAALTHVLAVAATDPQDVRLSWSNMGPWIGLAAPGIGIWTTTRGGGYAPGYGTSVAAPIVAGVAALVRAVNPQLTNQQVVDLLRRTSQDLGPVGPDPAYGAGLVQLGRAVQAAQPVLSEVE